MIRPMQRLSIFVLSAAVGLAMLLAGFSAGKAQDVPASPDITAAISGVVTDSDGNPLHGIEVSAYILEPWGWSTKRSTTSDDLGVYRIGYLNTGIYRLGFRDASERKLPVYYPDAQEVGAAADFPLVGLDVAGLRTIMLPAARITGTVTMWDGANPQWASISAYALQDGEWKAVKGNYRYSDSIYEISGLPPGRYRIGVSGYHANTNYRFHEEFYDDAVSIKEASDVILAMGEVASEVDFVLGDNPHLSNLSGSVMTVEGAGIPDIMVTTYVSRTWGWQEFDWTRTITDGTYTVRALPDGAYTLGFRDPRSEFAPQFYDGANSLQAARAISVTAGARQTGLDARLVPTGRIIVRAKMNDGAPPQSMELRAYSAASGYTLDTRTYGWTVEDGRAVATLAGLLPGDYRLYVSATYDGNSYSEYFDNVLLLEDAADVTVLGRGTTEVEVLLGENPNYAQLMGTVRTRHSLPLFDIKVTAYSQSNAYPYGSAVQSTFTDRLGNYRLWALEPNTYTVRFDAPDGAYITQFYANAAEPQDAVQIRLESGQVVTRVDAVLEQTGMIAGIITRYDSQTPSGVSLALYRWDGAEWVYEYFPSFSIDAVTGAYRIGRLATGRYRIGISARFSSGGSYAELFYPTVFYPVAADVENAQDIAVVDGETTPDINFVFGEDKFDARIEGLVQAYGVPLAEMVVEIYHDTGYGGWQRLVYIRTDSVGRFRIDGLAAGAYRLCVVDPAEVRETLCYPRASDVENAATLLLTDGQVAADLVIEVAQFETWQFLPVIQQ